MSSNPLQRSAKSARKRIALRWSIAKLGDPRREALIREMFLKRFLAFQKPLGIPRRELLDVRGGVMAQALPDPKFDNNWLSFNLVAELGNMLISALRVTRQIPNAPYPIREWTDGPNGQHEPMSTESWVYSRAYVLEEFRRNDLHLYGVGLTTICLAAMGRTELEALVAPNSVLLPRLRTGIGFQVSPRLDGKTSLPCRVGPGDNPDLVPIELRITKATLRKTFKTLRRIHLEKFSKWGVRVEHDELLCDAFVECGLDSANLSPKVDEDVSQIEIPKRTVLNEREFFGRWEDPVYAIQN